MSRDDDRVGFWSGSTLAWKFLRNDDSPANFIHRSYSREIWRQSGPVERLAQCGAFALRPITTLIFAAVFTRRHGPRVKRSTGKGILRQVVEEITVALRHSILPPWYYIFELYDDDKRARASEYVNRFETKSFAYHFLRAYSPTPAPMAGGTTEFLSHKVKFTTHCRQHGLSVIPALLIAEGGTVRAVGRGAVELPERDLFFKPVSGAGGKGATRWEWLGEGRYRGNDGRVLSGSELLELLEALSLERPYMVRPRIVNHPLIADLSNGTLTTVRVMTFRNERGEFEPVAAAFRMAQGRTAIVDNFHAGGIAAWVDVETGELGPGVGGGMHDPGAETVWHDTHPDTGGRITGRTLPFWGEVLELTRRAHARAFPDQVVIGWDVGLPDDGPVLVEGNKGPCVDILQRTHAEPMGNERFGELLAFNLERALAVKYARHEAAAGVAPTAPVHGSSRG